MCLLSFCARTRALIVSIHGRVVGRIKVEVPIKTIKIADKKIKDEKEKGFSSFKKPPQAGPECIAEICLIVNCPELPSVFRT